MHQPFFISTCHSGLARIIARRYDSGVAAAPQNDRVEIAASLRSGRARTAQ